eukprot:219668-Pyramimonas_sp.AAC.1
MAAHPSHVSWPHRELHRMLEWYGPHAVPRPFWHSPHKFRCPRRSSTEKGAHNAGFRTAYAWV